MVTNENQEMPFAKHKKGNQYLDVVRQRMIRLGLNDIDFLDLMHLTENSFLDQFKKSSAPQPLFTKKLIQTLYSVCHIDPGDFLIGEDEEEEEQVLIEMYKEYYEGKPKPKPYEEYIKNYFTREYWEELKKLIPTRNSSIELRPITLTSHEVTKGELVDFYEKIAIYYERSSHSIVAHEVLFKGNNDDPNNYKTYREAQDKIFTAIDNALSQNKNNAKFTYKRVFYLSPSESIHPKNVNDPDEMFKIMMIEASFETLRHIMQCLNRYPKQSEFFVAPFSGFRAHTLIDEKLFITEDYKKHADYIKPHLLFIDNVEAGSDVGKLKELFKLELEEQQEKKIYCLIKEHFMRYIKDAERYLRDRIMEQENVLHFLNHLGKKEIERHSRDEIITYKTDDTIKHIKMKTEVMKDILENQYLDIMGKVNDGQLNSF